MSGGGLVAIGDVFVDVVSDVSASASAIWTAEQDVQLDAPVTSTVGGCGVQLCVAATATGRWSRVALVGKIGSVGGVPDDAGARVRAELGAAVEAHLALDDTRSTGRAMIFFLPSDRRLMVCDVGANASFTRADVTPAMRDAVRDAEFVHVSGYCLLVEHRRRATLELIDVARAGGATVAFDLAPHAIDEVLDADVVVDDVLPRVDVLFAHEATAARLFRARCGAVEDPIASCVERVDHVVLFERPERATVFRAGRAPGERRFEYVPGASSRGQSARVQATYLSELSGAPAARGR